MIGLSFIALHITQRVIFVEYLFRVLVYLLFFSGLSVSFFWGFRGIGLIHAAFNNWSDSDDDRM